MFVRTPSAFRRCLRRSFESIQGNGYGFMRGGRTGRRGKRRSTIFYEIQFGQEFTQRTQSKGAPGTEKRDYDEAHGSRIGGENWRDRAGEWSAGVAGRGGAGTRGSETSYLCR